MYKQLMELSKKVEEVKKEFRRALLRSLGVDRLVKRAFEEGFIMGRDLDPYTWSKEEYQEFYGTHSCWRSVDEAFVNSDVEEEV